MGRLLLIPPVLICVNQRDPVLNFCAMAMFLFASLLDIVDGWLARMRGLVTFFGKFVDPLVDKIMAMALLVYFVADGILDAWLVVVLLSREFYMSGLRTMAIGESIEIVADAGGKAKTSFQLIGISFILVYYSYRTPFGGWINFYHVGLVLVYASMIISIYSAIRYTQGFIRQLAEKVD